MSWGYANRLVARGGEDIARASGAGGHRGVAGAGHSRGVGASRVAVGGHRACQDGAAGRKSATRRSRPSMKRNSSVAGTPRRRGEESARSRAEGAGAGTAGQGPSQLPMSSRVIVLAGLCAGLQCAGRGGHRQLVVAEHVSNHTNDKQELGLMRGKRWLVSRRRCWPMRAISATRTSSAARPRESSRISRVVESDTISHWQSDSSLSRRALRSPMVFRRCTRPLKAERCTPSASPRWSGLWSGQGGDGVPTISSARA